MNITCPYCGESHDINAPREIGRAIESCPLCRNRYELFYVNKAKPPTAMRLREPAPVQAVAAGSGTAASRPAVRQPASDKPHAPAPPPAGTRGESQRERAPLKPDPDSPFQPGAVIGGYRIKSLIGRGGMGLVFRAEQLSLRRDVALKVLSPQLAKRPQTVLRFMREAYAAAQLSHHHLVQVYDVGAAGPTRFFSMEFVQGMPLSELVRSRGPLPSKQAAGYGLQAARGLQFAHSHGLVHRDVKPANLLLSQDGLVKVADLGVVMTVDRGALNRALADFDNSDDDAERQFLGTPSYTAPEQAERADRADARSDVYSLGCTLYALLTGRPPFAGRTAEEVAEQHRGRPAVSPSDVAPGVDRTLSQIVMTMIAKRPGDRYQSMGDVVEALEGYLGVPAGDVTAATALPESQTIVEAAGLLRKNRSWPMIRAGFVTALATACVVGLVGLFRSQSSVGQTVSGYGFSITFLSLLFYAGSHAWRSPRPVVAWIRNFLIDTSSPEPVGYRVMIPAVIALGICYILGWLGPVLFVLITATVVAVILRRAADVAVEAARAPAIEHTQHALTSMRSRGLDEAAVRAAIMRHAGPLWRPLSEATLGQSHAIAMRLAAGPAAKGGRLDDSLTIWLTHRNEIRRDKRQVQLLAAQEALLRTRAGEDPDEAKKTAKASAQRLAERAKKVRRSAKESAEQNLKRQFIFVITDDPASAGAADKVASPSAVPFDRAEISGDWDDASLDRRLAAAAARAAAEEQLEGASKKKRRAADDDVEEESTGKSKKKRHPDDLANQDEGLEGWERLSYFQRRFGTPIDVLLGSGVRLAIAAVLLSTFAAWCRANKGANLSAALMGSDPGAELKPLALSFVPEFLNRLLGGWNAAAAGVILFLSLLAKGRAFSVWILLASTCALVAPMILAGFGAPGFVAPVIAAVFCLAALLSRDMHE